MNAIDFFNDLYSLFHNPISVLEATKFNSLGRFLTRKTANKVLPFLLKQSKPIELERIKKGMVVSLTSFPRRINALYLTIESLLRQTILPEQIYLYLSEEQFPNRESDLPESLLKYAEGILKIVFVSGDIRSHKKYYYIMNEFPNDIIINVDDDIFYPSTMIESLYNASQKNPGAVICRYARRIQKDDNNNVLSSSVWPHIRKSCSGNDIFFGTGGGVLYPSVKACLYKDVLNLELALKLCPIEDDLWMNTMIRLNKTEIVLIKKEKDILNVFIDNDQKLCTDNCTANMTDKQMKNIIDHYGNVFS